MKKKLLVILFLMIIIPNVYADEAVECKVSDSFLEWQKLSEEEKQKYNMPEYCESNGMEDIDVSNDKIISLNRSANDSFYLSPYASIVKDRGDTGECWAFATTSVLETYVRKRFNEEPIYSPGHMNYMESNSFYDITANKYGVNRSVNTGGNYEVSGLYLSNRLGPVFEEDYETITNTKNLPLEDSKNVFGKEIAANVNDIEYVYRSKSGGCTETEKTRIKSLISNYGASGASVNKDDDYFNNSTNSLYYYDYYTTNTHTNHAVTIIGWDDEFSRDKFTSSKLKPINDGAWIVQNSWGPEWGDNGKFYVSYEDEEICTSIFAIRSADGDTDDNKYIGTYGLSQYYTVNEKYAMNIFSKKKNGTDEYLDKVTFKINNPGKYKVFYYLGNAKGVKPSKMTLIASGTANYKGYVTVRPNKTIIIPKDKTTYSIAVYEEKGKIPIANKKQPVFFDDDSTSYANTTEKFAKGMSYVYNDGKWRDLYTWFTNGKFKAPINAFTESVAIDITSIKPVYTYEDYFKLNINIKGLASGIITKLELVKDGVVYATDEDVYLEVEKGGSYNLELTKNDIKDFKNGKYEVRVHTDNGLITLKNVTIKLIPIMEVRITNKVGAKLEVGQTLSLNTVVSPMSFNCTDPKITYTSSDENIASVDENGVVTAKGIGSATISATTVNGLTSTYEVVVISPIKEISVDKTTIKMEVGDVQDLRYSVLPEDNTDEDKAVKWVSSDKTKAVVVYVEEEGVVQVHALGSGVVMLTGTTLSGATVNVEVLIKGIGINPSEAKLELRNKLNLKTSIVDDEFNVSNEVTYTSSKSSVATVNSGGVVTAKKIGTTIIKATDSLGRVVTSKITVTKIQAKHFNTSNIGVKTYTGKSIKPGVKVSYAGKTLKNNKNYTLKYSNNKYPGKATIKIKAKKSSLYEGSKKVYFIIKPGKASISKLTTGVGTIKVTFKKLPKVTKYQIQYKVKEDSAWKTVNVTGNKTLSNLFSGFEYQVRLRGYVTVDNKNYFGSWSKVKTIKCK